LNRKAAAILVFDLGGGTFDVSILQLEEPEVRHCWKETTMCEMTLTTASSRDSHFRNKKSSQRKWSPKVCGSGKAKIELQA